MQIYKIYSAPTIYVLAKNILKFLIFVLCCVSIACENAGEKIIKKCEKMLRKIWR